MFERTEKGTQEKGAERCRGRDIFPLFDVSLWLGGPYYWQEALQIQCDCVVQDPSDFNGGKAPTERESTQCLGCNGDFVENLRDSKKTKDINCASLSVGDVKRSVVLVGSSSPGRKMTTV